MNRLTNVIGQPSRCRASAISPICRDKSSATTSSNNEAEWSWGFIIDSGIINFTSGCSWWHCATLFPIHIMLGPDGLSTLRQLFALLCIAQSDGNAGIEKTKADSDHYFPCYWFRFIYQLMMWFHLILLICDQHRSLILLKLASVHQICNATDIHATISNFLPELLSPWFICCLLYTSPSPRD